MSTIRAKASKGQVSSGQGRSVAQNGEAFHVPIQGNTRILLTRMVMATEEDIDKRQERGIFLGIQTTLLTVLANVRGTEDSTGMANMDEVPSIYVRSQKVAVRDNIGKIVRKRRNCIGTKLTFGSGTKNVVSENPAVKERRRIISAEGRPERRKASEVPSTILADVLRIRGLISIPFITTNATNPCLIVPNILIFVKA